MHASRLRLSPPPIERSPDLQIRPKGVRGANNEPEVRHSRPGLVAHYIQFIPRQSLIADHSVAIFVAYNRTPPKPDSHKSDADRKWRAPAPGTEPASRSAKQIPIPTHPSRRCPASNCAPSAIRRTKARPGPSTPPPYGSRPPARHLPARQRRHNAHYEIGQTLSTSVPAFGNAQQTDTQNRNQKATAQAGRHISSRRLGATTKWGDQNFVCSRAALRRRGVIDTQ